MTEISNQNTEDLIGHTPTENILGKDGRTIVKAGTQISSRSIGRLSELDEQTFKVKPYVSNLISDILHLSAVDEEEYYIAQANSAINEVGEFLNDRIETRKGEEVGMVSAESVKFLDVSPLQLFSVSTSLIPFLEHDDANRALMGSNMQRPVSYTHLTLPTTPYV